MTSIGTSQSTLWLHGARGERQITSEGYSYMPSLSADGKKLYYLVRSNGLRSFNQGALWVTDVETGRRQRLLPDFELTHYSISGDGQRMVFVAVDEQGRAPVWIASLNGQTPPRQLTTMDAEAGVLWRSQHRSFRSRCRRTGNGSPSRTRPPGER